MHVIETVSTMAGLSTGVPTNVGLCEKIEKSVLDCKPAVLQYAITSLSTLRTTEKELGNLGMEKCKFEEKAEISRNRGDL